MTSMKPLSSESVDLLTGAQVIVDLRSALKELVENSMDAGAKRIDIRLTESGCRQIVVIDDGSGVQLSDRSVLVQRHHTSKISRFDDIERTSSFGFRGEALAALCALSGSFQVTTRTINDEIGEQLEYNKDGSLSRRRSLNRTIGTTITITDLFASVPVRRQSFVKSIKKQLTAAVSTIQAYSLLSCVSSDEPDRISEQDHNIRITIWSDNRCILKSVTGSTPLALISAIFGHEQASQIQPVRIQLCDDGIITGWINKPVGFLGGKSGSGRPTQDRIFWGLNGRPVALPEFTRCLNRAFRSTITCKNRYPFSLLNVQLPPNRYDINVTPDKTTCMIHNEAQLLRSFDQYVQNLYAAPESIDLCTEQSNVNIRPGRESDLGVESVRSDTSQYSVIAPPGQMTSIDVPASYQESNTTCQVNENSSVIQRTNDHRVLFDRRSGPHESITDSELDLRSDRDHSTNSVIRTKNSLQHYDRQRHQSSAQDLAEDHIRRSDAEVAVSLSEAIPGLELAPSNELHHQSVTSASLSLKRSTASGDVQEISSKRIRNVINRDENGALGSINRDMNETVAISTGHDEYHSDDVAVLIDFTQVQLLYHRFTKALLQDKGRTRQVEFQSVLPQVEQSIRDESRTRSIQKDDFAQMQILGQFNLGFIVVRLKDDLFIVDQHAANEKFNYETLICNARLTIQQLIRPIAVRTCPATELIIVDHISLLARIGFHLKVDLDAHPGHRLHLLSVPQSDNLVFGIDDLIQIANHIENDVDAGLSSIPRLKASFASRACRMSIMIGDHLSYKQMSKVVSDLSTIIQPWNCPHGRPTIRHLFSLEHIFR